MPRPIALVTTLAEDGTVNAAPFSMFNMVGEDPPVVMLSVNKLQDGQLKDTAAHILRTQEFVVHLADEPIAAAMHRCGDRLPVTESELAYTGLHTPRTGPPPGASSATLQQDNRSPAPTPGKPCHDAPTAR